MLPVKEKEKGWKRSTTLGIVKSSGHANFFKRGKCPDDTSIIRSDWVCATNLESLSRSRVFLNAECREGSEINYSANGSCCFGVKIRKEGESMDRTCVQARISLDSGSS